jgi:ubiquinone/menaquinone biosynthesis C-methylase UbiE
LRARTPSDAYDLWARHRSDLALLASRDAETTRRKLSRVADRLPLTPSSRVLDVGPGDGQLFELISTRVDRCCGVDPSATAVERLRSKFAADSHVTFTTASADALPFSNDQFDVVVINSVLQLLPDVDAIEACLTELVRVCRPPGVIFVGELPFRDELEHGIAAHLVRKLRESGPANLTRLLVHQYVLPLLRREPTVLYPARSTHVPAHEVERMARARGLTITSTRHVELRTQSLTRNDYVIQVPPVVSSS